MDDLTIIKRVRDGVVDAYALLVRKYHRSLLAFIYRIVKDPDLAEDIGQEVFLKVYKELPNFDPERTPFAAWLYIAARNQCISELRKARRSVVIGVDSMDNHPSGGETAEAALIREEEMAALKASVQELPEPFRTTLVMSLRGASLEEIAQRCGVAQATVKTRLYRAREKLVLLLKGHIGGVSHERRI